MSTSTSKGLLDVVFLNAKLRAPSLTSVLGWLAIWACCHLSEKILSGSIAATLSPQKGLSHGAAGRFLAAKFWQAWKREVCLIERGRASSAHFAPPSFQAPYLPHWSTQPYRAVSSISWMSHIGAGLVGRRRIALLCLIQPPPIPPLLLHANLPKARCTPTIQTFLAALPK